jgi:cation:H+ antiporter
MLTNLYFNSFLIILSIGLLYYGAELLVNGSVRIASVFGIQKLIIGITIVAFGTSMPEFTVSFISALKNSTGIAVGNVVGSNILNIALILGISSLIRPMKVNLEVIKIEVPILFISTLIFNFLCLDGKINFYDSIILIFIFFSYIIFRINYSRKNNKKSKELESEFTFENKKNNKLKNILIILIGLILLVLGSNLLVKGSVFIARYFNISELVIGLTLVALGTSLPELFTSVIASIKNESDISIGNITGSNFFNIFFILGFVGLFSKIPIEKSVYIFDNWINLLFTVLLFPILITGFKISRTEGLFFLILYTCYSLNLYYKWIVI